MRVLVISDLYPPAATGGYERSCADVVRRWRQAGHDVTVLTTAVDGAPVSRSPVDGRLIDGPRTGGPPTDNVRRALPFVPSSAPSAENRPDGEHAAAVVRAALDEMCPDVVSVWNVARVPQAAVLGELAASGVPAVFVLCDGWVADAPDAVPPFAAGSRVVWVSDALRRDTAAPLWLPAERAVVGSGIATDVFRPHRPRHRPWSGQLLYVGRLGPAKGVDDAVAALVHLPPDVALRVVGPGTPRRRREVVSVAERLGVADRVQFDSIDRAGLPAIYRAADVVLFPSRWSEPFGLVPLEAMACGTPVVATGTGGSAGYLVPGTNALLVPVRDPAALAEAVRRLAGAPALRARLARHGLRTARRHDIDRVAATLASLHRRATARR
ncbi:MAG: glycosyltransferase family 4 protein [bacterium]